MDDINYSEKIATFNLLVGNTNDDIALNYLTLTEWDETKAAMLYNQENKGEKAKFPSSINIPPEEYTIPAKKNNKNTINYNEDIYANSSYSARNNDIPDLIPEEFLIDKKYNSNNKLSQYRQCEIYRKGPFDSFKIFKIDNRGYFPNFGQITEKCIKLYEVFINNLRNNVGIILLYNKRTYNDAVFGLQNLIDNEVTKNIIENYQTIIIPLIKGCLEADHLIKQLQLKSFPSIIICMYKNITHLSIIGVIQNIKDNIKLIGEKLIEAHDLLSNKKGPSFNKYKDIPQNNKNEIIKGKKDDLVNNNNSDTNKKINPNMNDQNILNDINNYLPEDLDNFKRDSISNMTDAQVLAKQEAEMKSLEKMEELKRLEEERKEKEKEEEEEKRRKEEELLEKMKMDSINNILPKEPEDDNPDKCVVLFRYPDGEKTVQRKFLKTDNVSLLYLYIKSLGREIYSEKEEQHFSLIQPFPFKNFDEVQNKSLEEEGLFPNALLQIKTIE